MHAILKFAQATCTGLRESRADLARTRNQVKQTNKQTKAKPCAPLSTSFPPGLHKQGENKGRNGHGNSHGPLEAYVTSPTLVAQWLLQTSGLTTGWQAPDSKALRVHESAGSPSIRSLAYLFCSYSPFPVPDGGLKPGITKIFF